MRLIIILFIFISSNIYAAEEMKNLKIYLTSLKSISIDFSQIDNSGKLINGKLLIQKPYNFRCNYYEPFPLLIVGNKTDIIIYDYEMEQTSYISASENIFNFLLVDTENFEEYFSLINLRKDRNKDRNNLIMHMKHNKSNRDFEIYFDKNNNQIKSIKILEENNIVYINFNNIMNVNKFDKNLFRIKNIDIFGPPQRLNAQSIEKFFK